jgi:hypothetical protein
LLSVFLSLSVFHLSELAGMMGASAPLEWRVPGASLEWRVQVHP